MQIFGIIDFTSSLFCAKEVLGKTFEISLAGEHGLLILPSLPLWEKDENKPLNKVLLPPEEAKTWKRGDEPLYWGGPTSYPKGEAHVEKALVKFTLPTTNAKDICHKIYDEFSVWINLFEQYVTLFTTQNTRCDVEGANKSTRLEILEDKGSDIAYVPRKNRKPIILITRVGSNESIHLEEFREACRVASMRFFPRLEYGMLLEAYHARQNADYRKTIIEAGSALEVCLTSRIVEEFKSQRISFGEKLLKKFRMLSGRFELIP